MIDCHVHTRRCGHAEGDAAAYVAVARERGVSVLTFTEHLPLPETIDPRRVYAMPPEQLPMYAEEVRAAAHSVSPGPPRVLLGIEGDWLPDEPGYDVSAAIAAIRPDFVLGSVHFVDEWAFDDPDLRDRYEREDVDALWERYFGLLVQAAGSGLFDAMAHPDLIKKFGHLPRTDPRELYDETARVFARAGVVAEVSTAGLRKPCAEIYPGQAFLERLAAHGVPVTIGSDAHRPDEVAYAFDRARDAVRDAGYDSIVYFEGRRMLEVPL